MPALEDKPPEVAAAWRRSLLWTRLADKLARACVSRLLAGDQHGAAWAARRSVAAHRRAVEAHRRGRELEVERRGMH
jgi:hypothetical protein